MFSGDDAVEFFGNCVKFLQKVSRFCGEKSLGNEELLLVKIVK